MNNASDKDISEIKSLIKLLDDEDEQIFNTARERLLGHGERIIPFLPYQKTADTTFERRVESIRETTLRFYFKNAIKNLKRTADGDFDLEEGVFLIARMRYFDLNVAPYISQLNEYASQLKEKLISVTDQEEILRRTISFFADEKGFIGNQADYYNEENHYINRVLETKTGIPITLSIVYLLVGKRIDLPITGVGLPGHFTLGFSFGNANVYFDPFNGGKILSRTDCEAMVQNLGFKFTEEYLQPVTNKQILERMFRNIILSLEKKQETERIETIRQFIDTLNSDL
ncbi:MAG: transglutaminase-like domain-containing protein [Bacteroidota bacterium]